MFRETNFSIDEISDKDIEGFCTHYLSFCNEKNSINGVQYTPKTFQGSDKKMMIEALKAGCQTPSGRMALRATIYDIQQRRKKDPNFKLKVCFLNEKNGPRGTTLIEHPDTIIIYPNAIKYSLEETAKHTKGKSLPDKYCTKSAIHQATTFEIANTFLHEAQHTRQMLDKTLEQNETEAQKFSSAYFDASTQAFSRQMDIESNNPLTHKDANISEKEVADWQKAVDYNPATNTINASKARAYSIKMQQKYGEDFIRPIDEKPNVSYANLATQWGYVRSSYLESLIYPPELTTPHQKEKNNMAKMLKTMNNLSTDFSSIIPPHLDKDIRSAFQDLREQLTPNELSLVSHTLLDGDFLEPEDFSSKESFEIANNFHKSFMQLEGNLFELSLLSAKIHAGDKDAIQKSAEIRAELEKAFKLKMQTHNKKGERISHQEIKKADRSDTLLSPQEKASQGLASRIASVSQNITQNTQTENIPPHLHSNRSHTA